MNYAAHMKALLEQRQRLAFRMLIRFRLANEDFNLFGKEPANGCALFSGDDFGLSKRLPVEAYRYVLLHIASNLS